MVEVIEALKAKAAREQEAVRARFLMIEILVEAVARLRGAGFDPVLAQDGDAVLLRLDACAWRLAAVAAAPVSVVSDAVVSAPSASVAVGSVAVGPVAVGSVASGPVVSGPRDALRAQMLDLRGQGKSDREVAEVLGLPIGSVENAFYQMRKAGVDVPAPVKARAVVKEAYIRADGGAAHFWTPEAEAQLIDLYTRGVEMVEIAAQLGRTRKSLSVHLTRLRQAGRVVDRRKVSPLDNLWSPERKRLLCERWGHQPAAEIARDFGLSRGAVSSMAHRLGLGAPVKPARGGAEQKSDKGSAPEAARPKVAEPAPAPAPEPGKPVSVAAVPSAAPAFASVRPAATPTGFGAQRGGALSAPGSRPMAFVRPVAPLLPGMTPGEKKAAIMAHVESLIQSPRWDAAADLDLAAAVFGGVGLNVFATDQGRDPRDCLARFDQIVAPFRTAGSKHLPIEAGPLILPALRARAEGMGPSGEVAA